MPTYDYQCSECQHHFEKVLKISEMDIPTQESCPSCDSANTVTKLMTAPRIGDPVQLGIRKPDSRFRERMQKIASNHPNNKMNIR